MEIKKHGRSAAAFAACLGAAITISCAGKIVYLGSQDAIFYKMIYEQCHDDHMSCENSLTQCTFNVDNLLYCPSQ